MIPANSTNSAVPSDRHVLGRRRHHAQKESNRVPQRNPTRRRTIIGIITTHIVVPSMR